MVLSLKTLVLVLASVIANPAAELDMLQREGDADPLYVQAVVSSVIAELENAQTPNEQCANAFLKGELLRKAALLDPEKDYAQQALDVFRAMRVDYLQLPAGQLGYIGESRVYRQLGNPEEALAALEPLLSSRSDNGIRRLSQLEATEAYLLIDPKRALAEAGGLGDVADWLRARAFAAMGENEKAADFARREGVVKSVSAYDRLQLLDSLGVLTPDERLIWAREQAAVKKYEAALQTLEQDPPPGSTALHASLLQQTGRIDQSLALWRQALEADPTLDTRLAYAVNLEAVAEQSGPSDQAIYRDEAIKTYLSIVQSDADENLRRDALRRWFYLSGLNADVNVIADQQTLIHSDPYLRFARIRVLSNTLDKDEVVSELSAVVDEVDDPELKSSAALMRAEQVEEPRGSLAVLEKYWDILSTQDNTQDAANLLRTRRWIALGMIDRATGQVLASPESNTPRSLLLVASALADRYADNVGDDTQSQVMTLASAAINQSPDDEAIALEAAELMMRVDARRDASRILESLKQPRAIILRAGILRELEQVNEALELLADIDSPEAALERGRCLFKLNRNEQTLIEARKARSDSTVGSDTWWHATLLLTRTYIALGQNDAASDVLRVSKALYPVNGRVWLSDALNTLEKELNG